MSLDKISNNNNSINSVLGSNDDETTTLINKNISLNQFIKKFYVDDKYSSHVNMIQPCGRFRFPRQNLDNLFNFLPNYINQHGLAEIPGTYIPLYFDFDYKILIDDIKENEIFNNKLYPIEKPIEIINVINSILSKFVDENKLHACLLEKDMYQSSKYMKSGIHIHYPKIFIKREIFVNNIFPLIKNQIAELDNVYNNPWLMYGAVKDLNNKPYLLTKIYNHLLNEMTVTECFHDYKIFDSNENQIEITSDNIESLLPKIFSINPSNREIVEINTKNFSPINVTQEKEKVKNERVFPININADREKLLICLPHIKKYNNEYEIWRKVLIVCKSLYDDDEGYDIFDKWSQDADSYDDARNRIIWDQCNITNGNIGIIINILKQKDLYNQLRNQLYKKIKSIVSLETLLFSTQKEYANIIHHIFKDSCYYTITHGWILYNDETGLWEENFHDDFIVSHISETLLDLFDEHMEKSKNDLRQLNETLENTDDKVEKYAIKNKIKELEKQFKEWGKKRSKCGSFSFTTQVMKYLKSNCLQSKGFIKEFENKPELFAFNDGTCINILTGERRKIEKTDKILYSVSYDYPERNQVDMDLVRDLLLDIFDTQDKVKDYINFTSLSLYGKNNNEKTAFHIGDGRNGKGVCDELCEQTFDVYYAPISNNILCKTESEYNAGDNSELKRLEYKRYVIASEPDKNSTFKTDTIKKLSGNDSISCKSMGKDKCEFIPKFIINTLMNKLLQFSHRDTALDNRVVIFKYENEFVVEPSETHHKQIDINLKRNISIKKNYRNGFLHLLLDAYKESKGIFKPSENIIKTTKEFMKVQNPLITWFENNYELNNEIKGIPSSILYDIYKKDSYADKTMSITKFGGYLKELCPCKKDTDGIRYKCVKKDYCNNNIINIM
jgi:phage/plasmid-associated DNA primase